MLSLREVQNAIRRSVVLRDDSDAAAYIVDDGLPAERRLAVYRNTFDGSLTRALRLSFPAIHRLVGAEFFEAATQSFVHEQPPHSAWLDEYGAGFAESLARFPPAASLAYLRDVARLEWAVNRALHAPDVEPLEVALLSALSPADHERVCFVAHPSVGVLELAYPADVIWRAVLAQDDAALAAIDLASGPVWLIVERAASGIDVTRVGGQAWRFTADLLAGQPLGIALEAAEDIDAPSLLADHLKAGRFSAFNLAHPAAMPQGSSQ